MFRNGAAWLLLPLILSLVGRIAGLAATDEIRDAGQFYTTDILKAHGE
jgi:hypothetical protein